MGVASDKPVSRLTCWWSLHSRALHSAMRDENVAASDRTTVIKSSLDLHRLTLRIWSVALVAANFNRLHMTTAEQCYLQRPHAESAPDW